MQISGDEGRGTGFVSVELVGGPDGGPVRVEVPASAVADGKVKVERGGGYDHYVRTRSGVEVPVFTWSSRTKIAE